jgi:uncharacterized protein
MAHCRKQQVSFLLTNQCNLNCDYCYINKRDTPAKRIDLNFAVRGMEDFFSSNNSRWIRFFGEGEPTVEFSLMKKIYESAHEFAGNKLKVELQTNGLFSEEVTKWISEHVDIVWVSHDGPHAHDIHRRTIGGQPSSPTIERNIKRLAQNENLVVGIRSTITGFNVNNQAELVDFFGAMGVKTVAADPLFVKVGSEPNDKIDLMEFAQNFLIAKKKAEERDIFYNSILSCNFDEKTKIACRACTPCPHLTPDGFVSACDMATSGDSVLKPFIYGKYAAEKNRIEYYPEKIKMLQSRNTDNLVKCKNCAVLYNCAGGCLGETLNECSDLFATRKDFCSAVQYLAKNMKRNAGLYPYLHA